MSRSPFEVPRRIGQLFAAAEFPWAVAGGWAIDLFLDAESRAHDDIEVAVWRRDQAAARSLLERAGYDLTIQRDGKSEPWESGEWLALPIHELHAVSARAGATPVEVLLNEVELEEFCFRRDRSIRRRLAAAMLPTASGLPALAPELVLLYKSGGSRRPKDEEDYHRCLPALSAEQRAWFTAALVRTRPDHPWLTALAP
jgi:hypothetical protein